MIRIVKVTMARATHGITGVSLIAKILTLLLLSIGVTIAISRQTEARKSKPQEPVKAGVAKVNVGTAQGTVVGRRLQSEGRVGQLSQLSPQEAEKLAEGLKQLLNKSGENLTAEHHPDGSVSVNLQGRFQNAMLARRNADGSVSQACVDDPRTAAAFFEIDQRLLTSDPEATPRGNAKARSARTRAR